MFCKRSLTRPVSILRCILQHFKLNRILNMLEVCCISHCCVSLTDFSNLLVQSPSKLLPVCLLEFLSRLLCSVLLICTYAYNWFTPLLIVYNIGAHSMGSDNSDRHHSQIPAGLCHYFCPLPPQKSVKGVTWASFDHNLSWIYEETEAPCGLGGVVE